MTFYLQTTAGREELLLPADTVWVNIIVEDENRNNTTMIDLDLDVFPFHAIQRITPEGIHVTLDCALGDDPAFREILKRYRGISMVEMAMFGFELTVII
jgi:hypothetical protein